jgi:DNA-binding FadR family transcriptional regulator
MLEREEEILNDAGKLTDHNRRFHEAIYYCSHNRYILKMLEYIQTGDASDATGRSNRKRDAKLLCWSIERSLRRLQGVIPQRQRRRFAIM